MPLQTASLVRAVNRQIKDKAISWNALTEAVERGVGWGGQTRLLLDDPRSFLPRRRRYIACYSAGELEPIVEWSE